MHNVIGIGIDMVDIRRINKVFQTYDAHFLQKIFTEKEITLIKHKNYNINFIAKRWAGKEAAQKALACKISWLDIEITNTHTGQPLLHISNYPHIITHISLTDEFPYAQAMVVLSADK